jgi:hypothetical protein
VGSARALRRADPADASEGATVAHSWQAGAFDRGAFCVTVDERLRWTAAALKTATSPRTRGFTRRRPGRRPWDAAGRSARPSIVGALTRRTTPPTSWRRWCRPSSPPASGLQATPRTGTLLRASSDDGVVAGTVLGRRVAYLSAEHHRSVYEGRFGHTDFVGFVDAARAWRRAAPSNTRDWQVDVGVGFRHAASRTGGAVRLDVAYGLRDGNRAMSAGWVRRWPDR